MKKATGVVVVLALVGLCLGPIEAGAPPEAPTILPASPYPVTIDGDPREALLSGALHLPGVDPISGHADGAFRGYASALEEGLYAAAMDTVGKGANLIAAKAADPGDLLLGEWVALRLTSEGRERLFLLAPAGGAATLDVDGRPVAGETATWAGMDKRFGHTWAGEWLIPWAAIGLRPGESFQLAIVRGRKLPVGGRRLEVLATTAPGISSDRFGATARALQRPSVIPDRPPSSLRALANYEVRPFVAGPGEVTCLDWTPAGEVATAWFEVPPSECPSRLAIMGAPAAPEFFAVDFWWQAGTREEQAALFPARVAAGEGDVLVAERLLPLHGGVLAPHPIPVRIYVRLRIPQKLTPGERRMTIRCETSSQSAALPWVVTIVPPLPPTDALHGVFYLNQDPARWDGDLRNMADHGVNAATCYARSAADQERFAALAGKFGIDGRFPMEQATPTSPGAWGYASDEPASVEAIAGARKRAQELRARGARPWAALCWPQSLELLQDLDGVALSPGVLGAVQTPIQIKAWMYFMAGREDPHYIRTMIAGLSRKSGLSGFWAYCLYHPSWEDRMEWNHPFYRSIALLEEGHAGRFLETIQLESLRDGIVDRRLAAAIEQCGGRGAAAAPTLEAARRGNYWAPEGRNPCGGTREGVARAWAALTP